MATIQQSLIELFKLDTLPPEQATETAERLAKLVMQAVLTRTLPMLSEANLEKYDTIIDTDQSPEVLFTFLSTTVPNFETIISEEVHALHAELAGEMESLTN